MKIMDILRSASPADTEMRIWAALILIVLCCCNPVKRVLDSNSKTQQVVDAYIMRTPFKVDTTYKYLPGDTLTQVLVGYDTAFIKGDTVNRIDTVKIKETTLKVRTVRDTVIKTVTDNRMLSGCQQSLLVKEAEYLTAKTGQDEAKVDARKWMYRFWGLVVGIILAVGVYTAIKLKFL
jgi:hypothetical protein